MTSDVSRIKERLNIVDVIGDYVKLNNAGSYYKARCPFHEEKTPSFVVNEDRQTYHCFGCEAGGDIISFIMEIDGLDFREALKLLAQRAGINLSVYTKQQKDAQDMKSRLYDILRHSTEFYEKQLWQNSGQKQVVDYLKNRGLSEEILKKFQLGFALDNWNNLENFLLSKGYKPFELLQTGVCVSKKNGGQYDRFRNRIIFPIADALGRIVGFTARILPNDSNSQAKYINTPETALYHKSNILYGIHLAKQSIRKQDLVIIVEGNVDVIASHQAGIENVVAVSGTALTNEHIKALKTKTQNFVLFFDADEAGKKAARRSSIACLANDIQLSLVSLKDGKDAADIVAKNPKELVEIIKNAKNALDFFVDVAKQEFDITTPHGKREAIDSVLELIAVIDNSIEKQEWIKRCANAFNTTTSLVKDAIDDLLKISKNYVNPKIPEKSRVVQKSKAQKREIETNEMKNNKLINTIFLCACVFPNAWRELGKYSDKLFGVEGYEIIKKLIKNGQEVNYEIGKFIEKYPQYEKLYRSTAKFKSYYEKTYGDIKPEDSMNEYITRLMKIHKKNKIQYMTERLRQVEMEGDNERKKEIMKEFQNLLNNY